jgi:hypothetical protein
MAEQTEGAVADRPDGPVSAAIIAAGAGAAVLGLFTTVAEISESFKEWLAWDEGVGPLAGQTGWTVIAWLLAWAVLHPVLRTRSFPIGKAFVITLILIGVGVLGTFPPFFQIFE